MLTKRLIACFDVKDGAVTKARRFLNNLPVGGVEEIADEVYAAQIDEVIFFDIMASAEKRKIDIDMVKKAAKRLFVPFTVGGGLRGLDDCREALRAGAEKVSLDSMAVRNPHIITEAARAFGSQCVVLSTQVKKVGKTEKIKSGYEVYIDGARTPTGLDALEWAKRGEELGCGEICVNSIDNDGVGEGFDLEITGLIAENASVPVIASGGAGSVAHLADVFLKTAAQAAIISGMLYSPRSARHFTVKEIKEGLAGIVDIRPYKEA